MGIILPAALTVLLFALSIFLLILPFMEDRLMEGKREMVRELTEAASCTLKTYAGREATGELTRAEAQRRAIAHLRNLRYGPGLKDYFWINDNLPRMIMHPYRPDLEGQDISEFTDPSGKRLFAACVETVRAAGAGYVDYQWQWMDDPNRIVPKISYVKGFPTWGWILGTGIYVEDVRAEIAGMTRRLWIMSLAIGLAMILLSGFIVWRGLMVTREKEAAEAQARMRQKQLFQASKMVSLGTLVSGVAHEINNPITSVMLNAPTLKAAWTAVLPILDGHRDEKGDFPVGGMPYSLLRDRLPMILDTIADDARRVRDIVTDLKDFARETPSEHTDDVDLNRVVEKAAGLVGNLIRKSTNHFSIEATTPLPRFRGNAQRVEQVVINLLVNACQALPDNTRPIHVKTNTAPSPPPPPIGWVTLTVQDAGCGMPEEVLRQIKDPFFTTRRDAGGTGLGLAISERIMRDHGGTLEFHSEPGRGTTVIARFPIVKKQDIAPTPHINPITDETRP